MYMAMPKKTYQCPIHSGSQDNQRDHYDELRNKDPLTRDKNGNWWALSHEDVVDILENHKTFSNKVSSHISVPNSMDPPEHTYYRALIEPYLAKEFISKSSDDFRAISQALVRTAVESNCTEVTGELGFPYAARAQCAFLGWPTDVAKTLAQWTLENQQAARNQDRDRLSELARQFESLVKSIIKQQDSVQESQTLTHSLIEEKINGRRLSLKELTSIFRNWTVGEVGSLSASVGIILYYLSTCPHILDHLKQANAKVMEAALDEILRIHGPLVSNRRKVTRKITSRGKTLKPDDIIYINWISANRDSHVFREPDAFNPEQNKDKNLLYGRGIHKCPGADLARMELRIFFEELFKQVDEISLAPEKSIRYAKYPASGFSKLSLNLN
mgnify:CR=1 FL=1